MTAADVESRAEGPWNPGVLSQIPPDLQHLRTICRPEHVSTSLRSAEELAELTGLALGELVEFKPRRLVLHELLIRVTADVSVPDGLHIGDLGINFRQITGRILGGHVEPQMEAISAAFAAARAELAATIRAAVQPTTAPGARAPPPSTRRARAFAILHGRRATVTQSPAVTWDAAQIFEFERLAGAAGTPMQRSAYRALARALTGLYTRHGGGWGTAEFVAGLATQLACNDYCSDVIGTLLDPLLARAARDEGYRLLPRQHRPIVMNTKGPSAAGKSTLRPLQKGLAGALGVEWTDFALISPDIWRKQLLDYPSLGPAYKYAGALTSEELQIVDQKLDRYMARKYRRGEMSHLLIDRFRFDSFAADSHEAGSNLLTRFGQSVYLFFVITAPDSLVERAWKRGLEFGRYKAVDDTLAHAVEAYTGMPDLFFTWIRRTDKAVQFEFLDNNVPFGEPPRTVAFGANSAFNVLDVKALLDVERYRRVNVDAPSAAQLYPDRRLLAPEHNTAFLERCRQGFRELTFASQATGRVYLRIKGGAAAWVDPEELRRAVADADTLAGVRAVAPEVLKGAGAVAGAPPQYLGDLSVRAATLGRWGSRSGP